MPDMLGTGISGLLAARVALDTISHNIANVNTEGYSRQSVELAARTPQQVGSYFVGQGVDVTGVQRAYSQLLATQLRQQNTGMQRAQTFSQLTDNLNNLLAGSSNVQSALDAFYASLQDAANTPTSIPTRQALLGKANSLVNTFHTLDQQLGQQWDQVNQRIGDSVATINGLTQGIAALNDQIGRAVSGGNAPNDLLDKRDQLLQQLSSTIGITTSMQGSNINVFAGNGQTLVSGSNAQALQAVTNPYDTSRTDVVSASGAVISGQIDGGTLGGLLDYRDSVLAPTRNQLGRVAIGFASAINKQHAQGMDLDGQLGGAMFTLPAPQVLPNSGNSGSAVVTATLDNPGQLGKHDYMLHYDGTKWSASTTGGTPVTVSGNGTASDPLRFDGLALVVSGTAVAGDTFQIQPTRAAAGGIELAISDPAELALAKPVKVSAGTDNQSDIGTLSVIDADDAALLDPVTIAFTAPDTFTVNGSGSYAYTPGNAIQLNGWSLTLDGTPAAGDTFQVSANTDGMGDNTNALALGATADQGILGGGNVTAGAAYANLIADDGNIGAQAQTNLDAHTSLYQQAMQSQQSVSGVNLDEEASNLIRYQQSYQAAAQVISTANTIFNTLINAVRS